MSFGFAGVREHIAEIRRIAVIVGSMLVFGVIVLATLVPLLALIHRPQHQVIQWNLDQYQGWINYGDTVPNIDSMAGIASKVPVSGEGGGWINPLVYRPAYVYNPKFIVDYNQCLSRALYSSRRYPGFHKRVSLCPFPPYNKRVSDHSEPAEQITVDIRKFGTNWRVDLKSTDRGIALTWNEYVSLVKMFKWVEAYYIQNRHYDFSINTTYPEPVTIRSFRKLGNETDTGIDVLHTVNDTTTEQRALTTVGETTTTIINEEEYTHPDGFNDSSSSTESPAWIDIYKFFNRTE